jgi:putative transposase
MRGGVNVDARRFELAYDAAWRGRSFSLELAGGGKTVMAHGMVAVPVRARGLTRGQTPTHASTQGCRNCHPSAVPVSRIEDGTGRDRQNWAGKRSYGLSTRLAIWTSMPRKHRLVIPGLPHHVIQRGNNREPMFDGDEDYGFYLASLRRAARRSGIDVHAYALMTTHVHFIATPHTQTALSKAMHSVGGRYATYRNQRYALTGSRFDGRYRSTVIDAESYLYTCMRYVELNPVRAGMVPAPNVYRWSSHAAHGFGLADDLVTFHPMYLELGATTRERQACWRNFCSETLTEGDLSKVRYAAHFGGALGPVPLPPEPE